MWQQEPPEIWWNSSSDAAGVNWVPAFEVPHQDRIEIVPVRDVTADDELLSAVGPPLEPIAAALARAVLAARALGHDSLKAKPFHLQHELGKRHVEGFRISYCVWQPL